MFKTLLSFQHHYGVYDGWLKHAFDPTYDGYKRLDGFVDTAFVDGRMDKAKALRIYSQSMDMEVACFNSISHGWKMNEYDHQILNILYRYYLNIVCWLEGDIKTKCLRGLMRVWLENMIKYF